jgi:hypothetical protein
MYIVAEELPWAISIKRYNVITCQDVLDAIYKALREPIKRDEFFATNPKKRHQITKIALKVNRRAAMSSYKRRQRLLNTVRRPKIRTADARQSGTKPRIYLVRQIRCVSIGSTPSQTSEGSTSMTRSCMNGVHGRLMICRMPGFWI